MKFKDAKKTFFNECRDDLIEHGFFEKLGCWFKIDMEQKYIIILGHRRLFGGKTLEIGFTFSTFLEGADFPKDIAKGISDLIMRDFEEGFASSTPGYSKITHPYTFPPLEFQVTQQLQYVKKLVLPQIKKIHTLRDFYDFSLFMAEETQESYYGCLSIFPLSVYFENWKVALAYLEHVSGLNEDWFLWRKELYKKGKIDSDDYAACFLKYCKQKKEIDYDKERVILKDKDYFAEQFKEHTQTTINNIEKTFAKELAAGLIR